MEQPRKGRIILIEDDPALIEQARTTFASQWYDVTEVNLQLQKDDKGRWQRPSMEYLESLNIAPKNIVVLDYNLKLAEGVRYSGEDVLRDLDKAKKQGKLQGLETVLVATSMENVVDGRISPVIAFVEGFAVYGMKKGKDASGKTDPSGYAAGLLGKVRRIDRLEENPLNAWQKR